MCHTRIDPDSREIDLFRELNLGIPRQLAILIHPSVPQLRFQSHLIELHPHYLRHEFLVAKVRIS
jgi:hypothetical protein